MYRNSICAFQWLIIEEKEEKKRKRKINQEAHVLPGTFAKPMFRMAKPRSPLFPLAKIQFSRYMQLQ